MSDPAGLVKVCRKKPLEAVRFDGSKSHAEAIIQWIREAHGYEVPQGHFSACTLYQPLRSGEVLAAYPEWWVVRLRPTDFVAYAPAAFPNIFEIVP